ncbi:alpha/beta fold hydrolase [Bradyrhizobium sp.]|uniref:alpha/beta fold hydrolase n=1 Tax=Bradyrhizobium sp. TaxID=376 RepID=UPI003C75A3E6
MPTVKGSDGANLHYAVHDYTDRWRKANTMILIHGFARSGDFWFGMIPYLARFYRVICPDLRGLGKSLPLADPANAISIDAYIGDIEAVADHAGAENFHLVGEAIGGAITLIFAAERPRRVRTLSVLAPAVWANDWIRNAYAVGYPSWVEAIRALGVEGWVRKSNTLARFPAGFDPAFMDWYAREVGKADVEVVAAMVNFAGAVNAKPYLDKIAAPVLALYPTGSNISSADQEAALRECIASVRVTHLDSPSAMLGMLQPAACASQILNFSAAEDGIVCRE